MDPKFAKLVEHLAPKYEALVAMQPVRNGAIPAKMSGIYMFSTPVEHLYVGRANDLRNRYKNHCGGTSNHAAFAFKLARIETGNIKATYVAGKGSRKWLMEQPAFVAAFTNAKALIRTLEYRYVEEADPNRQALLEIYCTIVSGAKHNDFENH
jgi:hypothetical protein